MLQHGYLPKNININIFLNKSVQNFLLLGKAIPYCNIIKRHCTDKCKKMESKQCNLTRSVQTLIMVAKNSKYVVLQN